jgi:hypothetical protein
MEWWAPPSSPLTDLNELHGVVVPVTASSAIGQCVVVADVLATEPHVALDAGRHGGVPASFYIASGFDPSLDVVDGIDTHHPQDREGRPHPGSGFCRSRLPRSAGAPRPLNPNPRPEGHFPSCRGGERVLPLDGPSGPYSRSRAKALGWWVSAPSHSLPGRSRDGSIPFGMRRGPPRAHFPPGPSRLDPEGFSPGRRPWGDGADCLLMLSG